MNAIFLIKRSTITIIKSALNFVMNFSDTESLTIKFIKTELHDLVNICSDYNSLQN